jgi:hypothetical protein
MRVKSDRPTKNGGWLHRLADPAPRPAPRLYMPRPRATAPRTTDWLATLRRFERDTRTAQVIRLATALGVSQVSLFRLGIAWAGPHRAWAFPMSNAAHETIGIRLRAENGQKWAVRGSRNGIFWPSDLGSTGPLLACEGPTDTAAMLDLGYDAIGRPSCAGGVELVIQVAHHLRRRDVVVVADADGPGIDGADRLAQALTEVGRRPKIIQPLQGKDARGWVQAGATRAGVHSAIQDARYWRPYRGR